jgi:hypothetical protein
LVGAGNEWLRQVVHYEVGALWMDLVSAQRTVCTVMEALCCEEFLRSLAGDSRVKLDTEKKKDLKRKALQCRGTLFFSGPFFSPTPVS